MKPLPERILKILGESPLPVSTPDLAVLASVKNPHRRSKTLGALHRLHEEGLVTLAGYAERDVETLSGETRRMHVALWAKK